MRVFAEVFRVSCFGFRAPELARCRKPDDAIPIWKRSTIWSKSTASGSVMVSAITLWVVAPSTTSPRIRETSAVMLADSHEAAWG